MHDHEVITDTPDAPPNPWRCYRACLEHAVLRTGYTHAVILQDDAVPCESFEAELLCAINDEPDALLVLWIGAQPAMTGVAVKRAWLDGGCFAHVAHRDWVPAVGTCMPIETARDILEWADGYKRRASRSDDFMLGEWKRHRSSTVLVTVPSIVQHPDDTPSLIGNGAGAHGRNPARTALFFIDD